MRLGALSIGGLAAAELLVACGSSGDGDATAKGKTSSQHLDPFDATRPAGKAPDLPRRVAWANTSDVGIFTALGNGMRQAATDSHLDYITANAEGDPQKNADDIRRFRARGVAGMTIQPLDPAAQAPLMQQAVEAGVCVMGIITNPCTLQVAASQYDIGLQQGRAAAAHIKTVLKGKATVFNANLNQISPQLVLRNNGVLAGLREAGKGVHVIDQYVSSGDQTPQRVFSIVNTLTQQHPDIKVVLGVDGFVLPAYRAFEQLRKLEDDMYFSSVDGDPQALKLVGKGGPYRASLAFAWTLMGYGMGRFTADWLAGKQIPRVMVAKTTLVDSPSAAATFLADARDPKSTFEDAAKYEKYLPLLGNVSYAQRRLVWNSDYEP
jgi:ribose transport system substrate-binding protein